MIFFCQIKQAKILLHTSNTRYQIFVTRNWQIYLANFMELLASFGSPTRPPWNLSNFAVQLKPENLAYHGQDPLLTLQLKCYYKGLLAKCVLHSIVVQIWWIKIQSDECFGFNQTPPPASPPRVHSIVVANGGASPCRLGSISLNSAFKSRYLCYVAWLHCRSPPRPPPPIWLLTNRRMMNQDESRSNLTRRNSSGY